MKINSLSFPDHWGNDHLSDFQTKAFSNELATYVHHSRWNQLLVDVATVLHKCAENAMQRIPIANEPSSSLLLFLMAHSHHLATARLVTSGHCLATYPTGRSTVESALYGWYLSTDIEAAARWHRKPEDKIELKKWSDEFRFRCLADKLGKVDERAANWAKELHQTAIDFGAHPNREALSSNVQISDENSGARTIKMTYLHEWDSLSIFTTTFTIETGMFTILLFSIGYPAISKALNLSQDLDTLRASLIQMQEAST